MVCHWELKTIEFQEKGKLVHLEALQPGQLELSAISTEQFVKWQKGNDISAMAIVETTVDNKPTLVPTPVLQVLEEFSDTFFAPSELPPHRDYDHAILLLPDFVPVNARPYRCSPLHKDEIERHVREMLQQGLISRSTSPFASPVLLVQKKDGTWHFCVDYRCLNSIIIKNKFPMPLVDDILDELGGAKWFSKLDFKAGFHQVRMKPEDECKTAFKTHHGH
jgi:hypothetical protein